MGPGQKLGQRQEQKQGQAQRQRQRQNLVQTERDRILKIEPGVQPSEWRRMYFSSARQCAHRTLKIIGGAHTSIHHGRHSI